MTVAGAELETSSHFNYIASVLTSDCSVDGKVNRRLNKESASFGRIRKKVIENHNLRLATKIAVYRAVTLSTLLYGSETLTLYRKPVKLFEAFHMQCIKKILGLTRKDRVPHTNILERAGMQSIECILLHRQLR